MTPAQNWLKTAIFSDSQPRKAYLSQRVLSVQFFKNFQRKLIENQQDVPMLINFTNRLIRINLRQYLLSQKILFDVWSLSENQFSFKVSFQNISDTRYKPVS